MSSTTSTSFLIKFLQVLLLYIAIDPAKAGDIRVCARSAEDTEIPVSGADVICYDDDTWSNDDEMASGTTGSDGCAELSYSTKTNRKWWHCSAWVLPLLAECVVYYCLVFNSFLSLQLSVPVSYYLLRFRWDDCWGNPDIYCEVSGTCLQPTYTSTKNNFNQNDVANFNVNVPTDSDFCEENNGWNGCGPSSIPDFLTDIASDVTDFRDACNKHDVCYATCGTPREDCENEFESNMYDECDDNYSFPALNACKALADLFVAGVTELGGDSCVNSREGIGCTSEQVDSCNYL